MKQQTVFRMRFDSEEHRIAYLKMMSKMDTFMEDGSLIGPSTKVMEEKGILKKPNP